MTDSTQLTKPAPKVAILLYGMLRTFRTTAPSFHRHVVSPNNADVFYFGPEASDTPSVAHKGQPDMFGNIKINPKGKVDSVNPVPKDAFVSAYAPALRQYRLHAVEQEEFVRQAAIVDPQEWIFGLNPARMFSMVFNMEGAVHLLEEYERAHEVRYDYVIITRPDLAFFSPIKVGGRTGQIHVPSGEGFDEWGKKYLVNAPVLYYKNVATGDYLQGGDHIRFNDQMFVLRRDDLSCFSGLTKAMTDYLANKVPASPETVFYLHLCQRHGLKPVYHPEWCYEIYRPGMPLVENVADTSMIQLVDRYHAKARERFRKNPVGSLLRDVKRLTRKVIHRITR
jgi:hypothetical protein